MEPFDRFDEVPVPDQWDEIVDRAGPAIGEPGSGEDGATATHRRRSTWVLVGAVASVLGLVVGFVALSRGGDGDDAIGDIVVTPTDVVDTPTEAVDAADDPPPDTPTPVDEDEQVALTCSNASELAEIGQLLRSGQPTYDYQPARDVAQLVEWSDVVVAGDLVSARRTSAANGETYTSIEVANVEVLAGVGTVERIGSPSLWAEGLGDDPLADTVVFEGVRFIAFLDAFPAAPGGWAPYVGGIGFGCAGTRGEASPVAESLAGLDTEIQDLSIDDVIARVSVVADRQTEGISRPVFADDVCPPQSALDFGARDGFTQVFFPRDEVFPIQIIGAPGGTPADPFALIQRWDEATDESIDGERVEVVPIDGVDVGIATFDNGNGEATWRLADGSIGYLRSRGLDRDDIEEIVGALSGRALDAPVPGFDLDAGATDRFVVLHESVNTDVSSSGAMSECRRNGDPWIYRVYAINGDPVARFVAVIDRGPAPYAIGEVGPTTVIIEGVDDAEAPGVGDVIDADVDRFAALTRQPSIAEQDNTPDELLLGLDTEAVLTLFDATGDGLSDQVVALSLRLADGVTFLEVDWADFESHPDAARYLVELDGGGAGASNGGAGNTSIAGSTSGFRLGPADATEPVVVTVKIVDADGRLLQLSPTVRIVPEESR
ncbi:hypothetical protein [Ilumatobacter coccineus]|uniref:Uncharacterized protein n=1 Tax=Ilumatobacter coccineus (strain NBRC 103263 / KCTC 29153 / YM16-304) TaxID=1313172 RepID=A0A6C7E5J5_ILUCY|nr:hypothetical protein [Ilumatobacter coccineus]BAN03044.1 hypothetical protein YM304_27300 [Ilumatobacter coccineus YM16-304]